MNSSAAVCRVLRSSRRRPFDAWQTMMVVATTMTRKASNTPLTRSSSRYPPAKSSAEASATSDPMTGSGSSRPNTARRFRGRAQRGIDDRYQRDHGDEEQPHRPGPARDSRTAATPACMCVIDAEAVGGIFEQGREHDHPSRATPDFAPARVDWTRCEVPMAEPVKSGRGPPGAGRVSHLFPKAPQAGRCFRNCRHASEMIVRSN